MKIFQHLVLVALAASTTGTATAARLRGRGRQLAADPTSGGCLDPNTWSNLQDVPGLAAYARGVNVVTGEVTDTPLLTDLNNVDQTFIQRGYGGTQRCFRVPSGFIFDFERNGAAFSSSSRSASDISSYQETLSQENHNKYSMNGGATGWGQTVKLSAAYTESAEMNNVRNSAQSSRQHVSALDIDVKLFEVNPPSRHPFHADTIKTWKTLMSQNAKYTDDSGTYSWRQYFSEYGTHMPTSFAVGGNLHFQAVTSIAEFESSEEQTNKFNSCMDGALGLSGNVLGADYTFEAEVKKCLTSSGVTSSSAAGSLVETRATAVCRGGASKRPITIEEDGSYSGPTVTPEAIKAWEAGLPAEPSVSVERASWITDIIARPATTIEGMSSTEKNALVARMEFMLGQYLHEHGMCTKFPGACAVESDALNLLAGLGTAGANDLVNSLPYLYSATVDVHANVGDTAKAAAMKTVVDTLDGYEAAQAKLDAVADSLDVEITADTVAAAQTALADAVGDVLGRAGVNVHGALRLAGAGGSTCVRCGMRAWTDAVRNVVSGITLRTTHNTYMARSSNGRVEQSSAASTWTLHPLGGGQYAMSMGGRWLSANDRVSHSHPMLQQPAGQTPGPWQRFTIEAQGDGTVAFKSWDNMYLSACDMRTHMRWNSAAVGAWEKFHIGTQTAQNWAELSSRAVEDACHQRNASTKHECDAVGGTWLGDLQRTLRRMQRELRDSADLPQAFKLQSTEAVAFWSDTMPAKLRLAATVMQRTNAALRRPGSCPFGLLAHAAGGTHVACASPDWLRVHA